MDIGLVTVLLFGSLFLLLALGMPVAFALGGDAKIMDVGGIRWFIIVRLVMKSFLYQRGK